MLGRSARNTQYFAVCVILLVGCKPREPVYDTDVDLGTENQPLLPADMYHVYGEELLRGRANDPDLSHLVPPEPDREPEEAEAGATVDPEIQALVEQHNQLLQAKKFDEATQLYKEEYRELALAEFVVNGKFLEVLNQVGSDWPMTALFKPALEATSNITLLSTTREDEATAIGTHQIPMPGAPPSEIVFQKIDGSWFFVGDKGVSIAQAGELLKIANGVSAQLDTILAALEDGSMNAQLAGAQVQQIMVNAGMKSQQILKGPATAAQTSQQVDSGSDEVEAEDEAAEDDAVEEDEP